MTQEQVVAVARQALHGGVNEGTVAGLRGQFRGMHLTFCSNEDVINAVPYLQMPRLNVYLVDGREHCLRLTQDLDAATGLVLAEMSDEEE